MIIKLNRLFKKLDTIILIVMSYEHDSGKSESLIFASYAPLVLFDYEINLNLIGFCCFKIYP